MKLRHVICHALLFAAAQTAGAQQLPQLTAHASIPAGPSVANLVAADMIVSDSMVLLSQPIP